MFGTYNNLTVIEYEVARNNHRQGGYKYLIKSSGFTSYTAYKTDKGFQFFLESRNLQLVLIDETYSDELGRVKIYDVIGEIQEESFWHITDIPENAVKFIGLSNGSLVDCYYLHTDKGSIIYRPNPNAREVYNPMPLDEHIEYQRING